METPDTNVEYFCQHGSEMRAGIIFISSLLSCPAGHGAGPMDAVPGFCGWQAPVGVHSVRSRRRRADMPRRDDPRGDGDLRTDGQVRRTVAQRRHDCSRARGSRVPGEFFTNVLRYIVFRFSRFTIAPTCYIRFSPSTRVRSELADAKTTDKAREHERYVSPATPPRNLGLNVRTENGRVRVRSHRLVVCTCNKLSRYGSSVIKFIYSKNK